MIGRLHGTLLEKNPPQVLLDVQGVAYEVDGVRHDHMPMTQSDFHHATPVYEYLDGWTEDISGARTFDELPPTCQAYVKRLEELIGCRISGIGVGPGREQSVAINDLI